MNIPSKWKPRLKCQGVRWSCSGAGGYATGFTPEEAYSTWVSCTFPIIALKASIEGELRKVLGA